MSPAIRIERWGGLAVCLALVIGTGARFLGRWHWTFELTTHFVFQATLLAAFAVFVLAARRHWKLASVAAGMALVNASEWVPFYATRGSDVAGRESGESLIVVSANVLSSNHDASVLDAWLVDADVAFISEVDPWWAAQIESWKGDWPYQIVHPRRDNFGLALISRHPIVESQQFDLEGGNPAVQARVRTPLGEWTMVGLHPFPPAGRTYSTYRNRQLDSAARWIERLPAPRVVLGDLNSTSSSPMFRDFMLQTGLRDSRDGFGWQPTWPTGSLLLRIPIDHVLVEPGLVVVDRAVGPDIGSDHLPVRVRLKRGA